MTYYAGLDVSMRDGLRRMEGFEAHHWGSDAFDEAMILLKDIVEVLDLQDIDSLAGACKLDDDIHRLQASQIGAALVNDHPVRHAVGSNSPAEEPARCRQIPLLRQHEIKGFAIPVNRPVEVGPPTFDLDVGLVHSPGFSGRPFSGLSLRGNQLRELHHLTV